MSRLLSTDYDFEGPFDAAFQDAMDKIAADGSGRLIVHRPVEIEHLEGDDCPCRPVVLVGETSLRSPESVLEEIGKADG